ncbi:TetR/AcrR family transcriptional regulator [Nocardia sp. NPDC055029]
MQTTPLWEDVRWARERIVEAAVTALSDNADVSMKRVAEVADVDWSTFQAYFSSRERLMEGLVARALTEGRQIITHAAKLPAGVAAIRTLAGDSVRFGDRYSFLIGTPELAAAGPDPVGMAAFMQTLQSKGVLRSDVTPEWLAAAYRSLAEVLLSPTSAFQGEVRVEALMEMFVKGASLPGSIRPSVDHY